MEVTSLAENLYFTTVRIDTVDKDGVAGSGTGFGVPSFQIVAGIVETGCSVSPLD